MEKNTIYEKLLEVQKEIKPIIKDSKNPHFKNTYFDINTLLAAVKPILNKYGLLLAQPLTSHDGKIMLLTQIYDAESGKCLDYHPTPLPECVDAQKYGSAITYFRRYALQSLLALEAEDDDGESSKNAITKEELSGKPIVASKDINKGTNDNFKI